MKKSEAGFTLIEVILGVTVSALVMVILFTAMRLGHRSEEKGLKAEEFSQRMRILSDRIAWLLRGAYPYIVEKPDGKYIYFSGEQDSAGFVTTAVDRASGEPVDMAGLKWVYIFADGEGLKIGEKLYYSEDVFEEPKGMEHLLDPKVKRLAFQYLSVDEKEKTSSWASGWSPKDKDSLPYAVRVSLFLDDGGRELAVPPIVVALRASHGIKTK